MSIWRSCLNDEQKSQFSVLEKDYDYQKWLELLEKEKSNAKVYPSNRNRKNNVLLDSRVRRALSEGSWW